MLMLLIKTINLKTVILISDRHFSYKKNIKIFGPPLCHLDQ